jgi:hypothetical protein
MKAKRKKNIKLSTFKGLRTQVFSRYDNGTVVVRDFSDNYWISTNCQTYLYKLA